MRAVIPIRQGICAAGFGEAVSECDGRVVVIGEGCSDAAAQLRGIARQITIIEAGGFAPAAWARFLAPHLADDDIIVLPASPDGRDLAPRIAFELGVDLHAGAVRVTQSIVELALWGGLSIESLRPEARFVATLQIGARDVVQVYGDATVSQLNYRADDATCDTEILRIAPPDITSIDLAEASRIVVGGAGIANQEMIAKLESVTTALGASLGATRVVTDRGWVEPVRQIGTTGVVVTPKLYVAFGVSGAVQHTSGIGQPEHIIAVNIDRSCPMMHLADLAVVGDANEIIVELEALLNSTARAK
ncbi:MAG: mycofactocin-associated electron transfer flavoprotein alpha subunit [Ilumatobacteraceae bacterium]